MEAKEKKYNEINHYGGCIVRGKVGNIKREKKKEEKGLL